MCIEHNNALLNGVLKHRTKRCAESVDRDDFLTRHFEYDVEHYVHDNYIQELNRLAITTFVLHFNPYKHGVLFMGHRQTE